MQISTEHLNLELRVLELEDTVRLLTRIAATVNDMVGTLNEISKTHTRLLGTVFAALESATDDDTPPRQATTP